MKSFIRYHKTLPRRIAENRYPLIRARIGYLYRADGKIHSAVYAVSDASCRDGAVLRMPGETFTEVYYSRFLPQIRNDAEQEGAAIYFDPYSGQFLVIGSKQLYLDAVSVIGGVSAPVFLENESPFRFDPAEYGAYADVSSMSLAYDEYFVPDITGVTVADCMVQPVWDDLPHPFRCAMDFFDRYFDRLWADCKTPGRDTLTELLAAVIRADNADLLTRLFALMPQIMTRFQPILREERKFADMKLTVPAKGSAPALPVINLFQYTMLMGSPDMIETLFRMYERPMELAEMLRHPMFYHIGFYHVRSGNTAVLERLLEHRFNPDAVEIKNQRLTLLSAACQCRRPAMVFMLIRHGASVEKTDERGKAAPDYAAEACNAACLAALFSSDSPHLRACAEQLAGTLPLDDDTQALLSILRDYLRG
ncbi:MAG: hypothetical protein MJ175_00935 [Clostridia bacterium]|nr:hypothetical protein [Clostridia bacterium]